MAPNPHHTLTVLYAKILRTLQNIPQDAAYRRYTEQIIKERALAVSEVLIVIVHTVEYFYKYNYFTFFMKSSCRKKI